MICYKKIRQLPDIQYLQNCKKVVSPKLGQNSEKNKILYVTNDGFKHFFYTIFFGHSISTAISRLLLKYEINQKNLDTVKTDLEFARKYGHSVKFKSLLRLNYAFILNVTFIQR